MAEHAHAGGHDGHHHKTGIMRWLTTTDHKEIGIMYLWAAFFFFILGGLLALLMRWELLSPGLQVMEAGTFNEFFSMHATVMIFLWVMPAFAGFGNYFVPIMVRAPDMAFPRINALSFWLIPVGAAFLWAGAFVPDITLINAGWTGYAPLSSNPALTPGLGIDFWAMGLIMLGTASTLGALNFLVTIIKMRGEGVTFHNMPLFVWTQFTVAILLLFATPVLTVAFILLLLDRNVGTSFFSALGGGDPILWQHLFWFFGHPEVYILILPAMGIVSEVIPKFTGRPIFGYKSMAYAILAIGFLGFIVWAHHMFTTGIDPRVRAAFMINTMIIGVPTGVKIFNWIASMWGGKIDFQPPMLFAVAFVALFVIGGIDGVFMASVPVDIALHDTYWAVAHIHYVLFAGAVMGIFAGTYYWFPRMSGRMYNKALANWHFWLTAISLNITFFFMHNLGLEGMPRRVADYQAIYAGLNQLASFGSFILGASQILFFANLGWALFKGKRVSSDPWAGRSPVEWQLWSPTDSTPRLAAHVVDEPAPSPAATGTGGTRPGTNVTEEGA